MNFFISGLDLILQSNLSWHSLYAQCSFNLLAILMPQAPECWDYTCEGPCSINLCFLVEMFRLFIFNVFVRIMVTPFCHSYSSYSLPFFCFVSHQEIILICFIFFGGFLVISLLFLVILLGLRVYIFNITLWSNGILPHVVWAPCHMDIHFSSVIFVLLTYTLPLHITYTPV